MQAYIKFNPRLMDKLHGNVCREEVLWRECHNITRLTSCVHGLNSNAKIKPSDVGIPLLHIVYEVRVTQYNSSIE